MLATFLHYLADSKMPPIFHAAIRPDPELLTYNGEARHLSLIKESFRLSITG